MHVLCFILALLFFASGSVTLVSGFTMNMSAIQQTSLTSYATTLYILSLVLAVFGVAGLVNKRLIEIAAIGEDQALKLQSLVYRIEELNKKQ